MIDPGPDPAQTTIRREQAALLHRAIARLPRRYLDAVLLCDLSGLTHAEAADRLGCPESTVSIRLKRAREQLRVKLSRHRVDFETALPPLLTLASVPRTLAASASAQMLAQRVGWTLAAARWQAAAVLALLAGVAVVGVEAGFQVPAADPQPPAGQITPPAVVQPTGPAPAEPRPAPPAVLPDLPQPPDAPKVVVGFPTVRDVVDYAEFTGVVAPSRTAEVRAHFGGIILSANVVEGDTVEEGQTLFQNSIIHPDC